MKSRDEYVRKMQAKLEEWNAEIDALAARAGDVAADAKNDYHEHMKSLKAKQTAARQKIKEMEQAGEGAWEDLKSGIEQGLAAVGDAIHSARNRFK